MYSNTATDRKAHVIREIGSGFFSTVNRTTHSSRKSAETVFTVTNGLVQGNKVTPNPISYTKVAYTAGVGFSRRHEIRNGFRTVDGRSVPIPGSVITTSAPIMEAAGTQRPDSGFPAANNWGHPDSTGLVRDNALEKVFSQLRDGPNLIVDLAESGSTLRMLKGTIRLRRVLGDFFKELVIPRSLRGVSSGQRRLDYITSKWLEYRYGWSPLVHSIYDAFDQLHRDIETNIFTVTGRSSLRRHGIEFQDIDFNPATYVTAPAIGHRSVSWKYSKSHWCEFSIKFKPSGSQLSDWTSLNPASIAWELLPLSFVADWLFTMGQYLDLVENHLLYRQAFLSGYRTEVFKGTCSKEDVIQASNTSSVSNNTSLIRSFRSESKGLGFTRVRKDRVILTSLPFPNGVHLRFKVGWKRQLDAAALIHNLVGRRFR